MTEPEQTPSGSGRRRIPFVHLAVLGLFVAVLSPFLRPPHAECPQRVGPVLEAPGPEPEGVRSCRRELERYTRERDPDAWAEIQLGIATRLASVGDHGQAAGAHRSALLVLTREHNPRWWGQVQYAIGRLLLLQHK